ncbi:glycosyltransferase [Psychrobacillus sp. FSL K6-2836]|uniref:glycosyltransferase n=1 Tax=Psychrobacillus sp. FSL K6-2836 TaxID=2921548 RepID=UPI0030F9ADEE
MRILFVGYNLHIGGIQRSLINILNVLATEKDIDIDLFLFSPGGELFGEIPKNVNVIKSSYLLRLTATPFKNVIKYEKLFSWIMRIILMFLVRIVGSSNFFKILFSLEKNLNSYDVAISYFNDVPGNYFNRGCNQFVTEKVVANKKIGWIHTDPIKAKFSKEEIIESYRGFDSIVNVSKVGKDDFDRLFPFYSYKSSVVYNLTPIEEIYKSANSFPTLFQTNIINFVTVARIDNASKRIDRIIEVVKLLKMSGYINFKWWIIGNGPDLKKNQILSEKYEVSDYITFVGEKVNPYPFIKDADAFVLTSEYEGFPMVINEALILCTPIITTAYASAEEQIQNGFEGIIVNNDIKSLYEVLKSVLDGELILLELKKNIKKKNNFNHLALTQLKDLIY